MKDVTMKEMALQQAVKFWIYLHNQAELKKQTFIDTPRGSPYKDEMRTEAEVYQGLAKTFAENFEQSITSPEDILHGLTADQATGFLDYLDKKIIEFKTAQEKTQRNKQEALVKAQDMEYHSVKRIYNEMMNLEERQIGVFENSLKCFMSILEEG